jgi:predicted acetyltransferase
MRRARSAPALELVEPSLAAGDAFLDFVRELRAAGEPLGGTEELDRAGLAEHLEGLREAAAGRGLEPWQVPWSTYWLRAGAGNEGPAPSSAPPPQIVGLVRLRHRLTPSLREHGGHVGYVVRPSARRRGFGTALLALALDRARALGLREILVTCDADNLGSRRIIEKNGGALEAEATSPESGRLIRRYWIAL